MTYRWSLKTRHVGIFKEGLVICLEESDCGVAWGVLAGGACALVVLLCEMDVR